MTASSSIRLLLASSDPAISQLVRTSLERSGLRYQIYDAPAREGFFEQLHRHSPDLIIAHVAACEGLTLREILQAAEKHEHGIPSMVLGQGRREQAAIRILGKSAQDPLDLPQTDYLQLNEVDRLPSIVERAIREQRTRIRQLRLESELRHATNMMGESQRLVTIGRLTGSIAHEINNPLEAVTNLLFLMEHEADVPAKIQEYLKMAQKELDRVIRISKQTLNFYRETTLPIPTRPSELINEVLILYGRRIAGKQIEVVRRFSEEERVNIFPGEIRQVFSNLIANAIEATGEKGRIHLRVRKSRLWSDAGITGLRIIIADTGMGMSPEVRRHIGKPFFTTKGRGGTGLGLWVSQSITERYGGALQVRSSTGERHGTVFSIFLPMNLRPRAIASPDDPLPAFGGLHLSRASRGRANAQRFDHSQPRGERDPANKAS